MNSIEVYRDNAKALTDATILTAKDLTGIKDYVSNRILHFERDEARKWAEKYAIKLMRKLEKKAYAGYDSYQIHFRNANKAMALADIMEDKFQFESAFSYFDGGIFYKCYVILKW